jgi:hypothetical protein
MATCELPTQLLFASSCNVSSRAITQSHAMSLFISYTVCLLDVSMMIESASESIVRERDTWLRIAAEFLSATV